MERVGTGTITDAVADTLFITVYMRCLETRRPDGIIRDEDACRIVDSVDYDFSKYDSALRSQLGTAIRVRHFDTVTREFMAAHDDPVVVSLGCGLDSRASRVGLDKGTFYNVDLPEVIALRNQLLPPDDRNISIPCSMFDEAWARDIRDRHTDSAVLVLIEGVLMYFTTAEARSIIGLIAEKLAPGGLLFDACTSFGRRLSSKHDTVKYTNASFRLGLDDDTQPEQWADNLRLREVTHFMDKEKHRWDMVSKFISFIPPFAKAFRILQFDMEPNRT